MLLTSLLSLMFLLSASFSRLVTLSSSICIHKSRVLWDVFVENYIFALF